MSSNPLLGITRDSEKGIEVIETERSPIVPGPGLIFERPSEGRCEERTLLADILPDGRFDVAASQCVRVLFVVARSLSDIDLSTAANDLRSSASFSARKNPQWIPANTPPVFPGLRPRIWPHLLRLVTNGNVGQAPCHLVSSFVEMKLALLQEEESQRTVHRGNVR
jgi:hypothetical protein